MTFFRKIYIVKQSHCNMLAHAFAFGYDFFFNILREKGRMYCVH